MDFLCIGLSHKTTPLDLRERLALPPEKQAEVLSSMSQTAAEMMLVSTCNRVEFYLVGGGAQAKQDVHARVAEWAGSDALNHLYEQRGEAALVHLFRVAASLDSMVVGEPQILGQVKDAFELAKNLGTARGELSRMLSAAFSSAKRVRSETAIGRSATSMASAAVALAKKIFCPLDGQCALIVGAGEMAELAAKHLRGSGVGRILVTNRTHERAEELARIVDGKACRFEALYQHLVHADVVVTSTASPTPIFTRDGVFKVLKARKYRRLLMVDLAVPRDIAPEVNTLENVYTFNVDDIQEIITENSAARAQEAQRAELIIAEEVARYVRQRSIREGIPVLAQLRARAEQIKKAEVEKTLEKLRSGLSEEELRKGVEALANALVNKLLHQPTAKLRSVSSPEDNRLAGAVAELFGLNEDETDKEGVSVSQGEAPALASVAAGGEKR